MRGMAEVSQAPRELNIYFSGFPLKKGTVEGSDNGVGESDHRIKARGRLGQMIEKSLGRRPKVKKS